MVVIAIPGSHTNRAADDVLDPIILDAYEESTGSIQDAWDSEGIVGVAATIIRKLVGSSTVKRQISVDTHPGCIACHNDKHITAVATPCSPNICIWLADKWASPMLYHPVQESAISTLVWGAQSDTLYAGTLEGVLIWCLRFAGLQTMEHAWCLRCDSPTPPLVSALTASPFGRVFVASNIESSTLTVWDGVSGDPTPVSCSGEAAGRGVSSLSWAPMGQHILVGFKSGSIALLSGESWRLDSNDTFELPGAIQRIAWVSNTTALVCCESGGDTAAHGLDLYTYTIRYEPQDDPFGLDNNGSIYNIGSQMCAVPLRIDPKPFLNSLKHIPISWESLYINDIACCPDSGLVAISVACKLTSNISSSEAGADEEGGDGVSYRIILPVVAVYSSSLSPVLSLVLVRTVQLTSSEYSFDESTLHLYEPRQFAFRKAAPRTSSSSSSLRSSHHLTTSSVYPNSPSVNRGAGMDSYSGMGALRTPSKNVRMAVEPSAAAECRALTQAPGGVLTVVWGSGAMTIDAVSLGVGSRW